MDLDRLKYAHEQLDKKEVYTSYFELWGIHLKEYLPIKEFSRQRYTWVNEI